MMEPITLTQGTENAAKNPDYHRHMLKALRRREEKHEHEVSTVRGQAVPEGIYAAPRILNLLFSAPATSPRASL